jgi:hypothetical protein
LFKEIIAVYSENHTKPANTLCGENAEFMIVKTRSFRYNELIKIIFNPYKRMVTSDLE